MLTPTSLAKQLKTCLRQDQYKFKRLFAKMTNQPEKLAELQKKIQASQQQRQWLQQNIPEIEFELTLPICQKKDDIRVAIAKHQVVIVCGETGSGKTTQLPKIALALGRGVAGKIGHTQPRRIAAKTVAARIAEELKTPLGQAVGYQVRFQESVSPNSYIKVMTDGILLAEIQKDRYLESYDTLIIDEAHERSLTIDFLLGYLKWLLPRRKDLKLIITSATIDPETFSQHFWKAPIIQVSGRSYPVDVWYRPPIIQVDGKPQDDYQSIISSIDEALSFKGLGDILVFLTGEREIREVAELLRQYYQAQALDIFPFYSRLSLSAQQAVFQTGQRRRVVLATNVAETSVTIPNIRFVIDLGLARISQYSPTRRVQRLPIQPISKASANQRMGRCGRVQAGVCFRLYSEQDFQSRLEFTPPEIQRTNLASVILQMKAMGLGDINAFPWIDPPDKRLITAGLHLLYELEAINQHHKMTWMGKQLARLPIDPQLAKMLMLAAKQYHCLAEVLVIVSVLAIQDPRERPLEFAKQADQQHQQWLDKQSDFLALWNLWQAYHQQKQQLSRRKLAGWCQQSFLSVLRMREWEELYRQLKTLMLDLGYHLNQVAADYSAIHQALLSGLLSHIGQKDNDHYLGARHKKFTIFPGSGLFDKNKRYAWIIAAELVETSQLYGRTVAKIEPQWLESIAKHLLNYHYEEPHWVAKRGQVMAYEQASLYGLIIYAQRRIDYARIDKQQAREIFIQQALVEGHWSAKPEFFVHNQQQIKQVEKLQHRLRRSDLRVDSGELYQFYQQRLPEFIASTASFNKWYRKHQAKTNTWFLSQAQLMRQSQDALNLADYPNEFPINHDLSLPLDYQFQPDKPQQDGITVNIPLGLLNQMQTEPFAWLIPGLLPEKIL